MGSPVRHQQGGNDPIELLTRAIHIGSTGEDHWEAVRLMEAVQVQITGCAARHRGAGGEVVVLFDPATISAAVHLRRGDMHVFLEKGFLA